MITVGSEAEDSKEYEDLAGKSPHELSIQHPRIWDDTPWIFPGPRMPVTNRIIIFLVREAAVTKPAFRGIRFKSVCPSSVRKQSGTRQFRGITAEKWERGWLVAEENSVHQCSTGNFRVGLFLKKKNSKN